MRALRIILLVLLVLVGSSCSDTFLDPFENEETYFSIYGYLDELERDHAVRVIPVTRFPEKILSPSDPQATIDAQVTSMDVATGNVITWWHDLERLPDGTYGHIFRSNFMVRPGHTYRLEVTRSDSIVTWAETVIPRHGSPRPIPDTLMFPYEVSPDSGLVGRVRLPEVESLWDVVVTYDLQGRFVRLPYGRPGNKSEDGGWEFDIDMGADAPRMRSYFGLDSSTPLPLLHAILLQVRVLDANWDPPRGIFDPELLAQPGSLSNVVNGNGFWGGVGLYQYVWNAPPGSAPSGSKN
ncbi:MAG: DUF4249 family protein [Bacteroidetes Order II. Incertae sedis bacterium]|nr:DUF4249 family protein [Bacteroidetes Order II. bacterium]MBT4053346.1 DUF4249 family protein [Bacteroidetes Order II. bacterium]MBT6200567.1 DUF4249 family protein [Bacteroidetes Order II. bacterium]